jgi:arginine metabolism regulation protein II
VLDVRDFQQVATWTKQTIKAHGRLDGAANMAGISAVGSLLHNETDEIWDSVVAVNAKGVFNCLRAQLPYLADKGSIVSFPLYLRISELRGGTKLTHPIGECR